MNCVGHIWLSMCKLTWNRQKRCWLPCFERPHLARWSCHSSLHTLSRARRDEHISFSRKPRRWWWWWCWGGEGGRSVSEGRLRTEWNPCLLLILVILGPPLLPGPRGEHHFLLTSSVTLFRLRNRLLFLSPRPHVPPNRTNESPVAQDGSSTPPSNFWSIVRFWTSVGISVLCDGFCLRNCRELERHLNFKAAGCWIFAQLQRVEVLRT
jgi:hypothetical protein